METMTISRPGNGVVVGAYAAGSQPRPPGPLPEASGHVDTDLREGELDRAGIEAFCVGGGNVAPASTNMGLFWRTFTCETLS